MQTGRSSSKAPSRASRLRCPCDRSRVENSLPGHDDRPAPIPVARDPSRASVAIPIRVEAAEVAEQMAVSEDDREELAIGLAIRVAESMPVDPHVAGLGSVETGDQLDQGRLAAAVAPGQDDQLARPERQVDGAEHEARVVVPVAIGERHAFEANRVAEHEPLDRRRPAVGCRLACCSSVGISAWTRCSETCARPRTGTHVKMMSSGVIR